MDYTDEVDPERAQSQWEDLRRAIEPHASVALLDPDPYETAQVFTRDNALVPASGKAVTLRSYGPRGNREPRILKSWFRRHGYRVVSLPRSIHLEGGNLLHLGGHHFLAGWKEGESLAGYRWLVSYLQREVHEEARLTLVRLADVRYLHLDMVVAPLGGRGFLVFPEGLNLGASWRRSELWDDREIITISREEARCFGANAVVIGTTVITGGVSDKTAARVERLGFSVERVDLSEFHKAGGGAHCLTLDLDPSA